MAQMVDDDCAVEDLFDLEGPSRVKRDMIVWDRDHKEQGKTTGGTRHCGMEGCPGFRVAVRWPDGHLTWPCTEGIGRESPTSDYVII
jgi:hypothetical protein